MTLVAALLAALAYAAKEARDSTDTALPVHFQAFAVDTDPDMGGAGSIEITIDRWTSEEERAKLRSALVDKGSDALVRALGDVKTAGHIRATSGGLGWDIRYARKAPLPDGGYRVVIGTDRPMSFYERSAHPRSADYEFLIAELRLGPKGEGEGRLFPAAKVSFDKDENSIEIENYANQPVRLTKVTELKSKKDSDKDKASKRDE
jgi:hypothetical protein